MPDKTVARYDGPRTLDELERYSKLMADGRSVLPSQYRNQPGAIMFAVEYAKALDVSPITALTGIHVIEGKPTASAGLISALIRRAGHQLRVSLEGTVEAGDLKAVATLLRSDDAEHVYRSTWTLQRAKRAGLLSLVVAPAGTTEVRARSQSGNVLPWEAYTESMLKARAITEVGRDGAEDVLLGVHYTAEELGAENVDANGDVVFTVTTLADDAASPAAEQAREAAQEQGERVNDAAAQEQAAEPAKWTAETIPIALVDQTRDAILDATSRDDLVKAWGLIGIEAVFRGVTVADEAGVETTLYDLFGLAVENAKAGNAPLRKPDQGTPAEPETPPADPDGAVEADVVEPAHDHPVDVACERGCPRYDPWATEEERLAGEHPTRVEEGLRKLEEDVANAATMPAGAKPGGHHEPEIHDVPSVQIGDPRHNVAIPGDSTAEERAESLRQLPIPDARAELDRIMVQLPSYAQAEVIEWAKSKGCNPAHSAGNCAEIARAIAIGDAFSDGTLSAFAAGDGEDPIALVIRVLGGEVMSTERHNAEQEHRVAAEERLTEDHVDAANFTAARRGTAYERSQAARDAAREAVKQSQK